MRLRAACAIAVLALPALAACASEPEQRIARAEFQCQDGRKLKVAFNLDAGSATVRVDRSKAAPVVLPSQNPGAGRNYAGAGYSLIGVGDQVTWTTPEGPAVQCSESR